MKRNLWLILVVLLPSSLLAQATRPVPAVKHAVIISVDGMRPDLILRANAPNVRAMMAGGSYSFWARSTEMSVTLPSHTSMLTGVPPEVHGIKFNDDGPAEPVYPAVPSIFELAKAAGYTTAMATGKSKLSLIARPGSVDFMDVPARGKNGSDDSATDAAVRMIEKDQPGLLFLHLLQSDSVGHAKGWGSPQHIQVLEHADECIGRVLKALKDRNLTDSTLVILTADHGGTGPWHGANDARARHIPWIVIGPGIRRNHDLDSAKDFEQVNIEDTFTTACTMLAIPVKEPIKGRMVWAIMESQPAGATTAPATRPMP